jgi:hypothetical protein
MFGFGPVERPVALVGVQLSNRRQISCSDPAKQLLDHGARRLMILFMVTLILAHVTEL